MARTVKFKYAMRVDGGGQPYPASRDATAPFFFLASQGIQRKKVGGGRTGTVKVRLPPSSRIVPSGLRN